MTDSESFSDPFREDLKDIEKGSEVNIVVVYKKFDPATKLITTHQRQLVVKGWGTADEMVYHVQAQGPVAVPGPIRTD